MAQGLGPPISTITGRPQPSFDEKAATGLAVGNRIKDYAKGLYYNINPSAGPEQVYESILAPKAIKSLSFGRRALLAEEGAAKEIIQWEIDKARKFAAGMPNAKQAATYKRYADDLETAIKYDPSKAQDFAKTITKGALHEQALGISRTPQQLLDKIEDVRYGRRAAFDSPSVAGHVNSSGVAELSPVAPVQRVLGHEGSHRLEAYWAHPNRMAEGKNPNKYEQQRIYNAKFNRAPGYHMQNMETTEEARKFYQANYDKLPSELHAEAISKWGIDFKLKNGRNPTDKEFYREWDGLARDILQSTVKDAPELAQLGRDQTAYFAKKHNINEYMYEKAPDSLMGITKDPKNQKGFGEHASYKTTVNVKVQQPDGSIHYDAMDGLNRQHALERARRNWDGAKVIPSNTIKKFSNTQDAVAYGVRANKKQQRLLKAAQDNSKIEADIAKGKGDFQKWMDHSTDAQFYREALEGSAGTHPTQRK